MSVTNFADPTGITRYFVIPYNSIISIETTYQIPGVRTRKKLHVSLQITGRDGLIPENLNNFGAPGEILFRKAVQPISTEIARELPPPRDQSGEENTEAPSTTQTETLSRDEYINYPKIGSTPFIQNDEKFTGLSIDDYNSIKEYRVGYFVFPHDKLISLLDTKFYNEIKALQNKAIIWRKAVITIYLPCFKCKPGFMSQSTSMTILKSFNYEAGDGCFGTGELVRRVNQNAFVINCYLKQTDESENFNKPNRLLISGTYFEKRSDYFDNAHVDQLRNILVNGFEITENFRFYPVFLGRDYYRFCRRAVIEGISRVAGSKNKPVDVDSQNFELF
jgi:hypothetical protein